jgi:tetratricopeptide (TPR) repeat protein/ssDNA-binding Zn-finger/Zn-ribbon topoisomerase 1
MSRSKSRKGEMRAKREQAASVPATKDASASPASRARSIRVPIVAALGMIAAIAATVYFTQSSNKRSPTSAPPVTTQEPVKPAASADYVGAVACKTCHEAEFKAWTGSHHQLAMQEANPSTVRGDFANTKFTYRGVESTFFKRDGKYVVRTDGPDGKLADYEVKYAFGVDPLQQYLVELPGGRFQALPIAWDTRGKEAGGQRWFHLYPDEKIDHRDALHWTGRYQNWNLQCAECHSTHLRKNYDAASDTYKTTFSEINVACEACHGPGSRHVEWARQTKAPYGAQGDRGFAFPMHARWNDAWKFPAAGAKYAQRDRPADPAALNVCAACHARRSTIAENGAPGAPLEDTHRLALLTTPTYHADGQQRDEDYVWGSFLQSRMFQHGVTCVDCHEPHALALRAEGNAPCTRCHNAGEFDSAKHHFHKAGTTGAQCVECHMPAKNYMVVDPRRDHSIRVPRPDLSIALDSPNACTTCHRDRKPDWAAASIDTWYGKAWRNRPQYGTTLRAASTQGAKALPALLELARAAGTPAIVRATAVELAGPIAQSSLVPSLLPMVGDADPIVRIAAAEALERLPLESRVQAIVPLLSDPIRGVRIAAARVLADVPDTQLGAEQRGARRRALAEYEASLLHDADWPASNVNLGNLRLRQGRIDEARAAFERALALDTRFVGAYVNLADSYRQSGRDDEGERVLRGGLSIVPRAADLHHALGLLLVRKGDNIAALTELAQAVKLAPDSSHFAYVYAIALHSAGRQREAIAALRTVDARHPYDLEVLSALISMNREAGDRVTALAYAKKAAEALPNDPVLKQLVVELETAR